jgi:hypothetical protein
VAGDHYHIALIVKHGVVNGVAAGDVIIHPV